MSLRWPWPASCSDPSASSVRIQCDHAASCPCCHGMPHNAFLSTMWTPTSESNAKTESSSVALDHSKRTLRYGPFLPDARSDPEVGSKHNR